MSVRLNPALRPLRPTTHSRDSSSRCTSKRLLFCSKSSSSSSPSSSRVCSRKFDGIGGANWAIAVQNAWTTQRREFDDDDSGDPDSPASVELAPISGESQFDRAIAEAQQLDQSVIFVWMASWCRKCIYLKPKLEKLAADYYPRLRFYCVDVNTVPHKLVARAGVTLLTYTYFPCMLTPGDWKSMQKMPSIQLWKDGKIQAEVIGGHKAYLVINEVREMIENEPAV